jgi:hypothetical protein
MSNGDILTEIKNAVGAHGKWKFNLKMAIANNKSDFEVDKVQRDDLCEFGKWLYSDRIDEDTKLGKPYEVITRLHGEFHKCAAQVLELALGNHNSKATLLLEGEFTERSDTLVRALSKWKGELR